MAKVMRKVRTGQVVRTRMDKTAVVEMVWKQRHRLYRKQVRRVARFYVHDPGGLCSLGDTVRIEETRPISKYKHWRLLEVLERRQVADVRPFELEADAELPTAEEDAVIALEADADLPPAEEDEVIELEADAEPPTAEEDAVIELEAEESTLDPEEENPSTEDEEGDEEKEGSGR